LKPVALDGAPGDSLPFVALPTDPAAVAKRKRIAIWLMVGGIVAGAIVALLTSANWAQLGTAVSLAGYVMFATADPRDPPPPPKA
jgi:fructose-specific phosphotransferase system IIC component